MADWFDAVPRALQAVSLEHEIYGNSLARWLAALAALLATLLVLRIAKALAARRAVRIVERVSEDWAANLLDLVNATRFWFLLAVGVFAASLVLVLPERTGDVVARLTVIVLLVQGAIWGNVLITGAIAREMKRRMAVDAAAATTMAALSFVGKLVLWSVAALLILENTGVDVTALVAGLGIGGIAVALAAQNILGDLFASLSIVLDKPFVLGDFIIVGDNMGTVERVGLKTTRLRSLSGEQLIFSNNDLLQSRIRNFKRMQERRILFALGVTYQTPADKLEAVPAIVRQAIAAREQTRFDRCHFKEYGNFALVFEAVYFVLTADFGAYMDIQQGINLEIYRRFAEEGIEFAYPTQTVYIEQSSPPPAVAP